MKDSIREITQIPELTMGLDLGDKFSLSTTIIASRISLRMGCGTAGGLFRLTRRS